MLLFFWSKLYTVLMVVPNPKVMLKQTTHWIANLKTAAQSQAFMSTALTCRTNFSAVNLSLCTKHFLITLCAASHRTTDLYYSVVIHMVLSVSAGLPQPNTSGACCAGPVWLWARSTQPRACQEQRSTVVVLVHSQHEACAGPLTARSLCWSTHSKKLVLVHSQQEACAGPLTARSTLFRTSADWRKLVVVLLNPRARLTISGTCWDQRKQWFCWLAQEHQQKHSIWSRTRVETWLYWPIGREKRSICSMQGLETHGWWLLRQDCATHVSIVRLHPLQNAQHSGVFTERTGDTWLMVAETSLCNTCQYCVTASTAECPTFRCLQRATPSLAAQWIQQYSMLPSPQMSTSRLREEDRAVTQSTQHHSAPLPHHTM